MSVDITKPADNDPIVTWPGVIRSLAEQVNINEAAIGGDFTRTVEDKTATEALSTTDLNKVFRVNSASAVTLTLPQVTADHVGKFIRVHKWGDGDISVAAGGTDTIANGSAGSVASNTEGAAEAAVSMIDLEVVAAGKWAIVGMFGTWSIS